MNALRIYAHGGRRPLGGPPRPSRSPLLLATAHASPQLAPAAAPPPSAPSPDATRDEPLEPPLASPAVAAVEPPPPTAVEPPPAPARTSHADAALLAILTTAPPFGETLSAAYARKERELRDVLATLPAADALALHARLADPRPGDALAAAFARLVAERRARLLAFLADAPRRDAIACARR